MKFTNRLIVAHISSVKIRKRLVLAIEEFSFYWDYYITICFNFQYV